MAWGHEHAREEYLHGIPTANTKGRALPGRVDAGAFASLPVSCCGRGASESHGQCALAWEGFCLCAQSGLDAEPRALNLSF